MWPKKSTEIRLEEGAQVAIIGGGPAGCFFALHLLHYARKSDVSVRVTLFEGRDFNQVGPQNCGKCAGILSGSLQQDLDTFGLKIPTAVIQDRIDSYVLHLAHKQVEIFPPGPGHEIITVFRGRGPRLAPMGREVSFDEWLLKEVERAGTHVVNEVVKKLIAAPRPMIETGRQRYTADLIVLANGINSRRLTLEGFAYHRPKTKVMAQDELNQLPEDPTGKRQVHIYFGRPTEVMFGAVVPKGSVTNISLLGNQLSRDAIGNFLIEIGTDHNSQRLCGCKSRISVSMARDYYADHFVAIGDAAATRLYKDGIGSAFTTAHQAAYTAVHHGVGRVDFKRHYAPECRLIALDNFLGQLLFLIWAITERIPRLTQFLLQVLEFELTLPNNQRRCRKALWNMFTGDDSYRNILLSLLNPRLFWLLLTVAWHWWGQRHFIKLQDDNNL